MNKLSTQEFSNLISEVYCSVSGGVFNGSCLPSLARAFSSDAAALVRMSDSAERDHILAGQGIDYSQLRAMMIHVRSHGCAPFTMDQRIVGKALVLPETYFDHMEDANRDFKGPYGGPLGGKHWLVGVAEENQKFQSLACFSRDVDQGGYSPEEKEMLELLLPHLRKAIEFFDNIADISTQLDTAAQVIDRTPFGMIFLNLEGLVLYPNKFAQQLVNLKDSIIIREGRLIILNKEKQGQMEDYFDELKNNSEPKKMRRCKMAVQSLYGNKQYIIKMIPMWSKETSGVRHDGKFVLIQVHTPDAIYGGEVDGLVEFYNLTKAETRVCQSFFNIRSLSGVATDLNISINTVKTHLSRVFKKIGVSTQAELLQRLALHPRSNW